jgi:hypothetical protein
MLYRISIFARSKIDRKQMFKYTIYIKWLYSVVLSVCRM